MSSESSVSTGDSSRLRQFGLYRTIDSRTEEFLRQSKKRQLKQGCACATISTVITVTIVITIILIYMKNGPSKESNKMFTKASWIGLINDSLPSPFEENFRKAKLKLDRSTIKLMPLLIEALKQNRYLEKILEDYSSSSSTYDGKATTEYPLEKNIFAHARTWMKNPMSRFYAIEYKAAPLVFFKKPTVKLAYISKLRKIRDYKNLFQHVDKGQESPVISDKFKSGTVKPPKLVPISQKKIKNRTIVTSPQPQHKSIEQNNVVSCNCPTVELGILLSKLLSSIQNFLPSDMSHKENIMPTTETRSYTINKTELIKKIKTSPFHMSEFNNVFQKQDPEVFTDKKMIYKDTSTMSSLNREVTKDNVESELNRSNSIKGIVKVTDVKQNIDPTELIISRFPTENMEHAHYTENLNENIFQLNGNATDTTIAGDLTKFKDQIDETTTLKPIANVISKLDIHSLELLKSKVLPTIRHSNTDENLSSHKMMPDRISLMAEQNEISSYYSQILQTEEDHFHVPSVFQEIYGFESSTESTSVHQEIQIKKQDLKPVTLVNSQLKAETQHNSSKNVGNVVKQYDEANKPTSDDYHEDEPTESMSSISVSLLNNTVVSSGLKLKNQNGDIWNFLNSNYDRSKMKSMIPLDRPTYLEIQRNSWKNDENEDYDVILLIYEYAIAIETSLVQIKKKGSRRASEINSTNDSPVADRLDRSYFGFDQDYYERMPLLVNALQENSYVDPTLDVIVENKERKQNSKTIKIINNSLKSPHVRRTSPRPFIFEYKSPTPVPFSKTYGSKSWVESYRNAQRLQNIQQVIKYLEKTINAKIGDMYAVPSTQHIAFTGVYVEPGVDGKIPVAGTDHADYDLVGQNSKRVNLFQSNHKSDPLFKYKPDSPGEVNLLADGFLRFSPTLLGKQEHFSVPMFKPIPSRKKPCRGNSCEKIDQSLVGTSSSETRIQDSAFNKPKTFSVMLSLFPLKPKLDNTSKNQEKPRSVPSDKIYITTSKPLILFKRKKIPTKRRTIALKRPRTLTDETTFQNNLNRESDLRRRYHNVSSASNMIVQINLYTPPKNTDITTYSNNVTESMTTTTTTTQSNYFTPMSFYTTDIPINLSTTQVEDFHVGSSGIIPIEHRTFPPPPPLIPPSTTYQPPFDVTISSTEGAWYTKPPDILKFSHEDAKISDEYRKYRELDYPENTYTNRRNSRDQFSMHDLKQHTIMTKISNDMESTTLDGISEDIYSQQETTTTSTTTQINGHYRSANRNSKILSTLLDPNSEMNRKRRLNLLAKGFRRPDFALSYTEIKRNKTNVVDNNQ